MPRPLQRRKRQTNCIWSCFRLRPFLPSGVACDKKERRKYFFLAFTSPGEPEERCALRPAAACPKVFYLAIAKVLRGQTKSTRGDPQVWPVQNGIGMLKKRFPHNFAFCHTHTLPGGSFRCHFLLARSTSDGKIGRQRNTFLLLHL